MYMKSDNTIKNLVILALAVIIVIALWKTIWYLAGVAVFILLVYIVYQLLKGKLWLKHSYPRKCHENEEVAIAPLNLAKIKRAAQEILSLDGVGVGLMMELANIQAVLSKHSLPSPNPYPSSSSSLCPAKYYTYKFYIEHHMNWAAMI
jgi:hypothetical protein